MTEEITPKGTNPNPNDEQKKYAGKFDTIEQLEEGYKNSAKVFQENEDLKNKLSEIEKVPESYMQPDGVELDESDWSDLREIAKHSQLNQTAFDRMAAQRANARAANIAKYDEARKAMSDEEYNVLESYVKKNYAPSLVDKVMKDFVVNGDARKSAMQHRESLLNGTVTGVGKTGGYGYVVTKSDVIKAAQAVDTARTGRERQAAQAKHIQIAKQYAAQKQANS